MSAITSRLSTQAAYTGQRGQEEVKYIRKAAKALKTVTEHGLCKVGEQWPTVKLQDITRNIKDTRGRLDYLTLNNVHLLSKLKARVFDAETVNHAAEKYMEDIDQLKEQIEANKRQFDAADKTFNRDIKMLKEIVAEAVQNPQVARILYADQKHVQVALDTMKARWEESDQHLSNLESQVLNFSKDTRYKASRALLKYVEPWRIQTEQRLEELECDVNGITVTVQAQQELKEQLAIEIRNNSALQLDHDSSIASAEDLRVQMTQALDDMTIQLAVMTTNFGILQIDHDSSIASAKDLHIQTTQAMDDMDKQLAEEVEKNSALQIAHDSLITRGEDLRVQTVQAMDDIKKQLVEEVTKNSALQIAHDALTTRVEDLRLHTAQTIEVVTNQLTMETKDKIAVQLAYDGLIKHASDQQTEAEENISRVSNQLLAETEKLNKLQIAYDDLVKHTADVQTETNDTLNRVSDQLAFETERSNKLQIANDGLIQQDADLKIKADETFNRISNHLALETEKSKAIEAEYQTCVTRNRAAMKDNQDEISHISNQLALETEKSIRLQNAHDNLIARVEDLQAQVERKEQEILSCKRDHNTDVLALRAEITELEESKSDTEFMLLSNQMETAAAEQKLRETLSAATLTIGELRESLSANELTRAADDVERLHRDAREAEERQREEVERLHHDAREAEQEQRQREEIERLQRDARDAEERQHKEVERLHHDAREAEQRTDQVKHKHAEEINGFNVQVQTHATEKESLLRQVRELGDESTKMVEEHKAVVLDLQIKYQNAVRRLLRPIIQRVTKSTVEPSKEIIKRYILVEKLSTVSLRPHETNELVRVFWYGTSWPTIMEHWVACCLNVSTDQAASQP